MDKPLVSVCIITYNHENYIKQTLVSVLTQQVDFQVEIILANDGSTDKTGEIIQSTLAEYTNPLINTHYFSHPKNLGMIPNFVFALKKCKGKYIAFCEGDDYWTDPLKLQKQVEFLEANKDYNLITGAVKVYHQNTDSLKTQKNGESYTFLYKDMIIRNHCSTCTTVIRNFIANDPSFDLVDDRGTDSQVWIRALGKNGKGYFSNEIVAVYRKHDTGVSTITHKNIDSYEKKIASLKRKIAKALFWNQYFGNNAKKSVLIVKEKMYKRMLKLSLNRHKYLKIITYGIKYLYARIMLMFI